MPTQACTMMFCGCDSLKASPFQQEKPQVLMKVYILLAFVLLVVVGSVRVGTSWFIYKDYYPLKERSPILNIMFILSVCGQVILYPSMYIAHYFTDIMSVMNYQPVFRSIQSGLEFSIFMIYLIRALRIAYAHQTHSSLGRNLAFKLFKKEYILALFVGCLCLMKALYVIGERQLEDNEKRVQNKNLVNFALSVEFQTPLNLDQMQLQVYFIWRNVITGFFWSCVLTYCIWIQRNVSNRYSMRFELSFVIISNFVISFLNIFLLYRAVAQSQGQKPLLFNNCIESSYGYPNTEFIKIISLALIIIISIIKPLSEKKVCHSLLPTGRHYGFIKTMRDFLMEEQFLQIFTMYLQELDAREESSANISLLNFWKQLVLLKLGEKGSEDKKLMEIRDMLQQVKQLLFNDQIKLIHNLQVSINRLEQSVSGSQIVRQKYRDELTMTVNELQKMALEKLDKIYTCSYIQTSSYQYLKTMTQKYKQVNLNMNILNMTLIVDYDNELT